MRQQKTTRAAAVTAKDSPTTTPKTLAPTPPATALLMAPNGTVYTLVGGLLAWAHAQDVLSRDGRVPTFDEIQKGLAAGHLLSVIAMFWGLLRAHHPDVSQEQAAVLLESCGEDGSRALLQALSLPV